MDSTWHEERDARTDGCENVTSDYKHASVQVVVTDDPSEFRVQLLTFFTLLQLSKWCRNIHLAIAPVQSCLGRTQSFNEFLTNEIKRSDPQGEFIIGPNPLTSQTITLFIGNPPDDFNRDYVVINSSGWLSTCGYNKPASIISAPKIFPLLGASFAACLGNAELFRYAVGPKSNPYIKWYSLWTNEILNYAPEINKYGCAVNEINLGNVDLVGCGAIGSSFIYLLPYSNCKGVFNLIDKDSGIESFNTTSSLLFSYEDARQKKKKVDCCDEYLKKANISVTPFAMDYQDFKRSGNESAYAPDIVLCFANENNIWSTIQHTYPPVCFHASTSNSWGINIGRHIPLKENCLACSFRAYINATFTPICSEVELPNTGKESSEENHTAILPFLSPAAAVVTLSEILKLGLNKMAKENLIEFNMSLANGRIVTDYQGFGGCYICKEQKRLYPKFGEKSKFWHLSIE